MSPLQAEDFGYTYADYQSWSEEERYELIDGEPMMQASPSTAHQETVGNIYTAMRTMLKGKPCKVYIAPLSVRLEAREDDSDDTVLEPDVFVVCDSGKMTKNGCIGAPDLVIEVVSPSSARHDRVVKFRKYQNTGVREYWIVDPDIQSVQINVLSNGVYIGSAYQSPEKAPISVLPGCDIPLGEVFEEEM